MHGEVCLSPFDWSAADGAIVMETRLVLSPFRVTKSVALHDDTLIVTEEATNEGRDPVEAMWSHHPAFGPPFLSGDCRLSTAATAITVDDLRRTEHGDLLPAGSGSWPHAPGPAGTTVDLRAVPGDDVRVERMAYLHGFARGWVRLVNPRLDAGAELTWDAETLPHAWYWLEAHATSGFPWYRRAYVLGIEPASTTPGRGIGFARERDPGSLVHFAPGQQRTIEVALRLTSATT